MLFCVGPADIVAMAVAFALSSSIIIFPCESDVNHCTHVLDEGRLFSITSPVLVFIIEILSMVCCATQRLWYLSNAIPYGRLSGLESSCIFLNDLSNGSKTDIA